MSYADFERGLAEGGIVILDGGTGSKLGRRGVAMDRKPGAALPRWPTRPCSRPFTATTSRPVPTVSSPTLTPRRG